MPKRVIKFIFCEILIVTELPQIQSFLSAYFRGNAHMTVECTVEDYKRTQTMEIGQLPG